MRFNEAIFCVIEDDIPASEKEITKRYDTLRSEILFSSDETYASDRRLCRAIYDKAEIAFASQQDC